MLTAEIPTAAAARHEGHPNSIFGFASITLASTTGFGHCYISTTGRMSSRDIISIMWRLLGEVARIRHTDSCTLITHRSSSLQLKTDMRWSCESQSQRHCRKPSPILLPADEEFTRMKVVLKVLALVQTGEPAGTQTHGPHHTSMNCGIGSVLPLQLHLAFQVVFALILENSTATLCGC